MVQTVSKSSEGKFRVVSGDMRFWCLRSRRGTALGRQVGETCADDQTPCDAFRNPYQPRLMSPCAGLSFRPDDRPTPMTRPPRSQANPRLPGWKGPKLPLLRLVTEGRVAGQRRRGAGLRYAGYRVPGTVKCLQRDRFWWQIRISE